MRNKRLSFILLLFFLMTNLLCTPANAFWDLNSWEIKPDLRIWGFDLALRCTGSPLFSGVDTGYFMGMGGGFQTFGLYREIDGTAYNPPDEEKNLALYKNANLTWSLGLKQGLIYDLSRRRNSLDLVLFYNGRYDYQRTDRTPDALFFNSDLPDRNGGVQNSIFTGLVYNGIDSNSECLVKQGLHAEASLEFAPLFLFNYATGADYTRFNGTLLGFITLLEGKDLSLYLAERFMIDNLTGAYIPIRARTTFGGFSKYPVVTRGLGGGVRGIEADRFDGYVKALNNLELRLIFPCWSEYNVVPEMIFYLDTGVYDDLSYRLDFDHPLASVGVGVGVSDIILYANYFINEHRFSFDLGLGIHF